MAWMKVQYRLTGDAPLLMHSGKLADPLSSVAKAIKQVSAKKAKTDADHERMATLEFAGSLYLDSELGPYIPGENIESSIYHAARKTKEGKLAASGLFDKRLASATAKRSLYCSNGVFNFFPK
jgi:hypothetical protein